MLLLDHYLVLAGLCHAPANLETICLLEIGDISQKSWLRCGCQFPRCALALIINYSKVVTEFIQ